MKTLVWTIAEFAETARRIAGRNARVVSFVAGEGEGKPMPLPTDTMSGYDLVFVFLHPSADGQALTDNAGRVVARPEMIRRRDDLHGAVVFMGACNGLENTTLLEAFRDAGVAAIIAGPGINYGGGFAGADVLGKVLRLALQAGLPPASAFTVARCYTALAARAGAQQVKDALEYQLLPGNAAPLAGVWSRFGAAISGAAGLLLLLLGLLFGWLSPGPLTLTQFSPLSPLPLPAGVVAWEKVLSVNGVATDTVELLDFALSATVTETDVIAVVDTLWPDMGFGGAATITLVDAWDVTLALTGYTYSAGSVITDSNTLTWTVSTDVPVTITRTWEVQGGAWLWGVLTETLMAETSTAVKRVYLGRQGECLPPIALTLESDYDYVDQVNTFTAWALGTMPMTYTWNFGDGNGDVTGLPQVTHVYTDTGTFYPVVEIEGCGGITDTVGATVHIQAATPTPTQTPTNTPTATPTKTPTPTPFYTPQPWVETPFPIPTLCAGFGCAPTPGARLPYAVYLPLIMRNP